MHGIWQDVNEDGVNATSRTDVNEGEVNATSQPGIDLR